MSRPQLFIMLKEPHPGRVKTRLGRDLGMTAAAWWFRHQALGLIRRLGRDPRWRTVLAVAPDIEGLTSGVWPAGQLRWPQGGGDLGDRMARIFRQAPPGPVLIVGADIPGITPTHIARAFAALGSHDAVLGPAPDGGFWLIGLKRGARPVPATLFDGVTWSGPGALEQTIASLGTANFALIDSLSDVDSAADLQ